MFEINNTNMYDCVLNYDCVDKFRLRMERWVRGI